MATASVSYGAAQTMTMTLAALASDTALNAGRASTAIDVSVDTPTGFSNSADYLVGGKVTTGTGPTTARQIEIWAYGSYDGTTFSGGVTGTDAGITFAGEKTSLKLLIVLPTDATANHTYEWGPVSIAAAYGGVPPPKWGLYIVHNTGAALNATAGNHEAKYTPIKFESN